MSFTNDLLHEANDYDGMQIEVQDYILDLKQYVLLVWSLKDKILGKRWEEQVRQGEHPCCHMEAFDCPFTHTHL